MRRLLLVSTLALILVSCSKEKRSAKAGARMQEFVEDVSRYARDLKPGFIIIPQNGAELAFQDVDSDGDLSADYLGAIDGIGIEGLFYNGDLNVDDYRLDMLRKVGPLKMVMVADYLDDNSNYSDAVQRCVDEGFISFPRESDNYDYEYIPDTILNENANDINHLEDVQNYLYLISTNSFSTKQEMLNTLAATNFDLILIDLFWDETAFTSAELAQIKTKANGGKRLVISYINVGAAESYRYYWQDDWKLHKPKWLKKKYDGYDDEIWVKFWCEEWEDIIYGNDNSYMKKIINAGFDGAYLDNVEAYYFLYYDD